MLQAGGGQAAGTPGWVGGVRVWENRRKTEKEPRLGAQLPRASAAEIGREYMRHFKSRSLEELSRGLCGLVAGAVSPL